MAQMKIAVLLSGQPRYLEQGSWWFKNRVFPDSYEQLKVDYFCHFWKEPERQLWKEIDDNFKPVKFHVAEYDDVLYNFRERVRTANMGAKDWHLVPPYVHENIAFKEDYVTKYGFNFHGMFLSASHIAKMCGDLSDYDIVIKTRSDAVFNPMAERDWVGLFNNMLRNPVFNDNIFAPWLRIKHGAPFFGDLAFVGRPKLMYDFLRNIDEHMFKILTTDKHLFSELLVNNYGPIAHWMWSRLSLYSQTDWLSIGVVWPVPFDVSLIRNNEPMHELTYANLRDKYAEEEARRHSEL